MKPDYKKFLLCILIPLAVGGLSALLTQNSMRNFEQVVQPPLSPPAILFPIVWTLLYILMGITSYLILQEPQTYQTRTALFAYGLQLFFNFFWSILFFNLEMYFVSFLWLIILWALIALTILLFSQISKPATYLMIPYLLWVTFAGYLNFGIFLLN